MRKLFSALAVVLVFAMAFTITASANTTTVSGSFEPDEDGKYIVTYENTALANAMVGMVVIEAADVNNATIDENSIRYIDQVDANASGAISVGEFAPMAKTTTTNKYLVYVGGGTLTKAENIGMLNVPIAPETVTISEDAKTMIIDDVANLSATIGPDGATGTLSWDSDNKAVATVDSTGKVTALAKGTANITVTVVGTTPAITDTCVVTVNAPALTGVTVNKSTLSLAIGDTETLTVNPVPAKAEITGAPAWTSDAPTVASVDAATGKVTAVAEGTANITVTVDGFSATCVVTVTEKSARLAGDADGNGKVNVFDALRICQYIAASDKSTVIINLDNSDVNGMAGINVFDALRICQYIANAAEYPLY